jgi:Tol biopolymer transport system component
VLKNADYPWGSPFQLSPDGKRLAYVQIVTHGITIVDLEGKNGVVVARGLSPSWSPDGKRLVYDRIDDPKGIHILDLDTRKERKLADGMCPSWSR